jgi:ubiquitin-protein ligase
MASSPRERRLANDLKAMLELRGRSTIFRFEAWGDPPQRYRVVFRGRGLAIHDEKGVYVAEKHEVLVVLGPEYPRFRPDLKWESPVFHPNISESGLVCLGGYSTDWVPSLTIDRLCTMLWDMVRWDNFDVRSPYNLRAASWTKRQVEYIFPVDDRQIRDLKGESGCHAEPVTRQGIQFLDD